MMVTVGRVAILAVEDESGDSEGNEVGDCGIKAFSSDLYE